MGDNENAVAEAIGQLEEQARERERAAAAGEILYESGLPGGGLLRRHKQSTMVKAGGVELPERVRYYRSANGMEAWLPTAQLPKMLAKRHEDGSPVFVKEQPSFINENAYHGFCEVCRLNRPNIKTREVWPNEFAYYGHMSIFHPMEWEHIQKRAEKKEGVLSAVLHMTVEERAALQALLGGTNGDNRGVARPSESRRDKGIHGNGQGGAGSCAECDCGWKSKPVRQLAASLATHQRFHCPSRQRAE